MSTEITPAPKTTERHIASAPIHPLAALTTIVLDSVFGMIQILPGAVLVSSLLVGGIGTLVTTLVQRYLAKDEWGPAVAKGLVMGVLAGVPFPVTGTAAGAILLAWAGAEKWIKLPPLRTKTETLAKRDESEDEVIDAEIKEEVNNEESKE